MPELDADFEISTNNLEAEYEITQSEHFDCSFEIYASGTTWGGITGNIEEQTDLQDILSDLQSNIDDFADDLSIETDSRQTADADLQDNIDTVDGKIDAHIADKSNPHEVTKAQIGLGNVDNTSDLNKPISTATQTALNDKQNTINDLATIRTNASNGQSAYNTIQNYGDIVTYNASDFATSAQGRLADTAIQPSDLASVATSGDYNDLINKPAIPTVNNSKITIQKNSADAGSFTLNQSSDKTINISVPTQASDINAVPTSRKINNKPLSSDITLTASDVNALSSSTTINDLTTSAQQDALNSGATSTNIGQIATNTQNITNEVTNRQNADNNLQSQIDAIVASSDVFDIVGTYADLQAYDISTVPVNDIIKVLVDLTHSNAATYYRCVETGGVKSWSYIGSEGAYYTKSESDSLFVEQTTTVNNKPLSTNITLTASDVGALPSSTTIGNGVLTIQNNSVDVDTFNANATSNKTINIVTPTKTSDLTNDSGFIDNTDLTNGLATKQDTLIAGTDLEIIPAQAPILPEGFTQIEYIEGTGTQYIDTGFYGTQNSGAYIRFALTDLTSEGSARVFGTRIGTAGTKAFAFISSYDGSSLPSDKFYIGSNGYASWPANLDTNWHEVSCNIENDKKVYFDGNLIITGGNTAYTSTAQASIFRRYNQNTYSGKSATAKISILQIYENAVMVHNFIPCRRDSDDELGMYDLVSDTFFTNSGTGTFIAGADVVFTPQDKINFTNASGYITGITSSDVTTALGYTPYDSSNPAGFTSNVGTVTSVNNTQPDSNGDVTLTIPTVNDGVLTITQNGTSKGTFSANQSTNDTIALTDTTYNNFTGADGTNAGSSGLVPAPSATDNDKYLKGDGTWAGVSGGSSTDVQINGTSITSNNVANILTESAYSSSNKIATMSDLPSTSGFLENTATGNNALTILGNPTSSYGGLNIGTYSTASNNYGIAIGNGDSLTDCAIASGANSIAMGFKAKATAPCSIQIGTGTNSTARTVYIGGYDSHNVNQNYQILDIETGLIPDVRISANIQRTSTAVTHTANTAVGSSTTPVYINSSGVATSTGLSIANSRFDGQWVQVSSAVQLTTDYTPGTSLYTIGIALYLPSGSSNYDVLLYATLYTKTSSGNSIGCYLGSDLLPITTSTYTKGILLSQARTRSSSSMTSGASCILPVGSSKSIYLYAPSDWRNGTINLYMTAYRRIGTNT